MELIYIKSSYGRYLETLQIVPFCKSIAPWTQNIIAVEYVSIRICGHVLYLT